MTCLSSARLAYFSNRPLGMLVPQIDASQWAKTFIERTPQFFCWKRNIWKWIKSVKMVDGIQTRGIKGEQLMFIL